ncbi:probable carboxylesterase 2 [Tanacetum coccineum]
MKSLRKFRTSFDSNKDGESSLNSVGGMSSQTGWRRYIDPYTEMLQSKDVVISPETGAFVRIYIPKTANSNVKKLPVLIYFHGGAFIIETAASPTYHNFLNLVSSESNVVVVSVDYRTAPEHPVPICFDDSWEAVKCGVAHKMLRKWTDYVSSKSYYTDFSNVFFRWGTSAGADYYSTPFGNPGWVLVCVAGKDILKDRGIYYKVVLGKNGWKGDIEVIEDKEEDHVFFLNSPLAENSCTLRKRISTFINN